MRKSSEVLLVVFCVVIALIALLPVYMPVKATIPAETEPTIPAVVFTMPSGTEPTLAPIPEETEATFIEVETIPVETEPAETEPIPTKPQETEPTETQPAPTEPKETIPVVEETEPAETAPTIPEETIPAIEETIPEETTPTIGETEPTEPEEVVEVQPLSIEIGNNRLQIRGGKWPQAQCFITDENGTREYELKGWPASADTNYRGYYFAFGICEYNEGKIITICAFDNSGLTLTQTYQVVETANGDYVLR